MKIEHNRFTYIGLETDDLGAISTFSGGGAHGDSDSKSTIKFNSVCDAPRPDTKGIYLDNCASGWVVEGNVILRTAKSAIFVHSGSNNRISHNIFVNANNHSKREHIVVNAKIKGCQAENNTFTENIVYLPAVDSGVLDIAMSAISKWDKNVYYSTMSNLSDKKREIRLDWNEDVAPTRDSNVRSTYWPYSTHFLC